MKRLFVCAVALGLFAFVPASAQGNDHHGDRNGDAGSNTSHAGTDTQKRDQRPTDKGGDHSGAVNTRRNTSGRPDTAGDANTHRNSSTTTQNQFLPTSGDVRRGPAGQSVTDSSRNNTRWTGNTTGRPPAVNSRNSNWSGNTSGGHSDVNALRRNMQATQRFRGGSYNFPQGYQYRHWSYGERLPRGYLVRNYWIANFVVFGLFAPPSDLVWVRVGDDALLVDQETGDIVQVRYGVFY